MLLEFSQSIWEVTKQKEEKSNNEKTIVLIKKKKPWDTISENILKIPEHMFLI